MNSNCDYPAQVSRPIESEDPEDTLDAQRILNNILPFRHGPLLPWGYKPEYDFKEHHFLGDHIKLREEDGEEYTAGDKPFILPNGLSLTYGQINGLAGDFFGTQQPISDGDSDDEKCRRFTKAWETLALATRNKQKANDILGALQTEVDALKRALKEGKAPSEAYRDLPDISLKLQTITMGLRDGNPSYLGLARINFDHFGHDAHEAYVAGHTVALKTAAAGDLQLGYAINAFADHFLQDSFSAGHARTPRRYLHRNLPDISYDLLAKFMHDEDNAIGLNTQNNAGDKWKMFGDKHLLNKENERNMEICQKAVQASANEIFEAWKTGHVPKVQDYICRNFVPSLSQDSARGPQDLAALFICGKRRKDVLDRRTAEYIERWSALGTLAICTGSGRWIPPITLDGPHKKNSQDGLDLDAEQLEALPAEEQVDGQNICMKEKACIWCT